MFETITETIAKLMGDEKMADAMADLAILRDETAEIQSRWAARDAELLTLKEQHEADMTQLKGEAEATTTAQTAREAEITEVLARAVQAYKIASLKANPDLPAGILDELGETGTVEQIDANLAKAQKIVDKVKSNLAVPGGAPPRGKIDIASMSSLDKIRHAITN